MMYFHLLSKEQAEEAIKLPNLIFQKTFRKPDNCGFFGALDKTFGCPFLIPYTLKGIDINGKCRRCTCRKETK